MPLTPYFPGPSCGGMNGTQLSRLMYAIPHAMKSRTTVTLMTTMTLLKVADSLMPMMRRMVMNATMNMAGRLSTAPVDDQPSVNNCHTFHQAAPGTTVCT